MPTRTTETTVTFGRPFRLKGFDQSQPAGTYRIVVDEEQIPGISFLAYRRTSTILDTPAITAPAGLSQSHLVDRADLEAALEADAAPPP